MNSRDIKKYMGKNILPLITEAIFIFLALIKVVPMIYLNFLFYLALIIYFACRHEYSFRKWKKHIKTEGFKKKFLITLSSIGVGFLIMTLIQNAIPGAYLGEFNMVRNTPFTLFLFAIQTIVFPPLAEEMFYRKYLIATHNERNAVITLLFSSLLFAAEHAIYPLGILTYMILGIAFGTAYLYHKDIYAMMTSHFVVNLIGNGMTVILTIQKWA